MAVFSKLSVTEKVKRKVTVDCKEEFLKHHPEFKDIKVTENILVNKLAEFYLRPFKHEQQSPK